MALSGITVLQLERLEQNLRCQESRRGKRNFVRFLNPAEATWLAYSAFRNGQLQFGAFFMKTLVTRFLNDESGATAIEYALIASGISIAIIAMVNTLGSTLNEKFIHINSQLGTTP